jgi:predicted RNase H-like HicB family nuclease
MTFPELQRLLRIGKLRVRIEWESPKWSATVLDDGSNHTTGRGESIEEALDAAFDAWTTTR